MPQLSKTVLERDFQRKGKGESESARSITYDKESILTYCVKRQQ